MGWIPLPAPPGAMPPRLWRAMCEGCGAPVQANEHQCSYCLRPTDNYVGDFTPIATTDNVDRIEVTTISDDRPRFITVPQPKPERR